MVLRWKWLVAVIILNCVTGCGALAATEFVGPKFDRAKLRIGKKTISVEVAKSVEQQQHGLMYRSQLLPDEGMLFIFDQERILSFWMKNTYIDLDIAYISAKKAIVDIQEMKSTNSLMTGDPPSYPSARPAQYALEMNRGWFKKNKIKKGDKFEFVK
jgi:uncharacterized protein